MSLISSYIILHSDAASTHTHAHAHIILPVEKTFFIQFLEHCYELTPHQICFVPPGVAHTYQCKGLSMILNIPVEMVKPIDLALFTECCVLDIDGKLELLVCLIKQEIQSAENNKESLRYLFYYLYDKLVEHCQNPSLRYLQTNYAEPINMTQLASMEGYNTSYYTHWFKRKVGCTPSEDLRITRIEKAKEILATTHYRLLDVAFQVGYTNSSSFIRAFKTITGMTPQEYRSHAETKQYHDDTKPLA